MPLVSVTRARVRGLWSAAPFALRAIPASRQAMTADGVLHVAFKPDRRLAFWTMTVWRDEAAMRAYMRSGAHGRAMPGLSRWCDEASVVHWDQPDAELPSWDEAVARMRRDGRPSKLRRPSPDHAAMTYADPQPAPSSRTVPLD